MGNARAADGGERASAPRLHGADRGGAQRDRRELPRPEAGARHAQGHKFVTETDTEIIAHLIEQVQKDAEAAGKPVKLEDAVRRR